MNENTYKAKGHYKSKEVALQYDEARFKTWYGQIAHLTEERALRRALRLYCKKPGTILDLPCGTARLLPVIIREGHKVTGGDISEEMIGIAKKIYGENNNVDFRKVDGEKLPFSDNSFDYLTSYRLMCHLPSEQRQKVLNEMIRVTRHILIINYHFECFTPIHLFNSIFRKTFCSPYPLKKNAIKKELTLRDDIELLEIKNLSWYERSSYLAIIKKL